MAADLDETRRLRELLSDTIVLLCKNGLQFEQEFSIEALVGITLDRKNVMLVSIRETINTAPPEQLRVRISTTTGDQSEERDGVLDNDNGDVDEVESGTDDDRMTNNQTSSMEQSTTVINKKNHSITSFGASASQTNVTKSFHVKPSSSLESHHSKNTSFVDNDSRLNCKRKKSDSGYLYNRGDERFAKTHRSSLGSSREFRRLTSGEELPGTENKIEGQFENFNRVNTAVISTDIKNTNVDGRNRCKDDTESFQNPSMPRENNDSLVCVQQARSNSSRSHRLSATRRSRDRASAAGQGWGSVETSGYDFAGNLGDFVVKVENESLDDVCYDASSVDAEVFGGRVDESTAGAVNNKDFMRSPTNLHESTFDNYVVSQLSHPALSPDDVSVAAAILSIPGCFINMGCVKAIRQSLRKVSKETLVTVLERMSVPESSPFFVGAFRSEGVSRTFYKCPPDRLHPQALALYNVQYSAYVSGYYEPVRYPNNLKDPTEWIIRWKTFSPFPDQRV